MNTFDAVLGLVISILIPFKDALSKIPQIVVNRDLNGRVRLIFPGQYREELTAKQLEEIAQNLSTSLLKHGFPTSQMILFEDDFDLIFEDVSKFPIHEIPGMYVVDRLATESRWANISPVSEGAPRVAFFSIKGGVGRSTAMTASAWALAQSGKRVLILDMDLESPGLSSALLPEDRRPAFGITDWLIEDLVDNGDGVFEELIATSTLARDGEIFVVPAHGRNPGEYIAKLGRVWMPKTTSQGRETWSKRLERLIDRLENKLNPDVILIDSRSGIDDISSSCVTDLRANLVLLFAIDGEQTWMGYRLLFDYWKRAEVAPQIRERLQLIGSMIPETNSREYFERLREQGWDLFAEGLYDEVPSGAPLEGYWNFDETDEFAPHYPWVIRWHRGFAALSSLHQRFNEVDPAEVELIFGPLVHGITNAIAKDSADE